MMIDDSFGPLIQSLPLTLSHRIGDEITRESEAAREYDESRQIAENEKNAIDLEAQNGADVGASTDGREEAASQTSWDDEPDMDYREQADYGFAHPAASRPQRTVWMAKDTLGLSSAEMAALQERGIDVSIEDAEMDAMGNVRILGPPPEGESRA